jgi:NDP-sugar pyrophosphorylase family protein
MTNRPCAIVLAGGVGSRLKPFSTVLPKPLMPVAERPILEIVLDQLRHCGFGRVILAVNHRDSLIRAVIGDQKYADLEVIYSKETRPLGTIAPLHLVADQLGDSFLVMNGDLLTDLDFGAFLALHRRKHAMLSVGVVRRDQPINYGVIDIDQNGQVTGFREKPTLDLWVSMGVYAMDREILEHVPADRPFGFDDLMLTMLAKDLPIATRPHLGQWHDIGRPDDFEAAARAFETNPESFLPMQGAAPRQSPSMIGTTA